MLNRIVLNIHDRLAVHDRLMLATALAVMMAAVALASRAGLDMSFRPLFAHDDSAIAATAAFEERFGQSSGAAVAVLLSRPKPLDGELLGAMARLTEQLGAIDGVVEVLSPARMPAVEWSRDGARGRLVADPAELRSPDAAAAALEAGPTGLVADSGRLALALVRLAPPLDALGERRAILRELRAAAEAWRPQDVTVHYTGVSVVEDAYAAAVPEGMALSLVLTTAAVAVLLYGLFGHAAAVLAALAGVAVAAPLTMALLALAGRPVTMLASVAPTVILIVGAADAVHMVRRWQLELRIAQDGAVRRMMSAMALPCALTTLTTALGFTALVVARIEAIREFGLLVAAGVLFVFAANLVLVPAVLRRYGRRIPSLGPGAGRGLLRLGTRLTSAPALVLGIALLIVTVAAAGVPRLLVDQRFNEELAPHHEVRAAQDLLERHFGGFLGPDLEIARTDGGSILAPDAIAQLAGLRAAIARLPGVDGVSSVLDVLPDVSAASLRPSLDALRADALVGVAIRERLHTSERTAFHIGTADLGTAAALRLARDVETAAARLGPDYEARIAGQWWLAQLGMSSLLRDMLLSFATSALLVLPVLALALGSGRLLLIALPPNLLPMIAALAWMGWTGMTLRIGTALVLAVALAIAVDDTIHILTHAEQTRRRGVSPRRAIHRALADTGPALIGTTVVLLAGFLSMAANPLRAIQDMGVVAAVALLTALLADLLVLPPLYATLHRRLRHRGTDSTSYIASSAAPARRRLPSVDANLTAVG